MTDTIDQLLAVYTDNLLAGNEDPMTAGTNTDQELSQLQDVVQRMVAFSRSLEFSAADRRTRAAMKKEWSKSHSAKDKPWRSSSARRTRWVFAVAMATIVVAVLVVPLVSGTPAPLPGTAQLDSDTAGIILALAGAAALVYYIYSRGKRR